MRQLSLIILFGALLFSNHALSQNEIKLKMYDTEFGRFDLWFYNDQIAGSYEIKPKQIIGSVLMKYEEDEATGRWFDPDGQGDITLIFKDNFKEFRADYRSDKEPEKWYRDQWHGTLKLSPKAENIPCISPSHELIHPFIGTWQEYEINENGSETFIGTLNVKLGANGCSLSQVFVSPDSTFFYTTMGFVNSGSGIWEETYIFSTGATANYQWIVDSGDIVQRRIGGTREIDYLHQLRFTELTWSSYLVVVEQSHDGGKSWKPMERTRVKRVQ